MIVTTIFCFILDVSEQFRDVFVGAQHVRVTLGPYLVQSQGSAGLNKVAALVASKSVAVHTELETVVRVISSYARVLGAKSDQKTVYFLYQTQNSIDYEAEMLHSFPKPASIMNYCNAVKNGGNDFRETWKWNGAKHREIQ